jgi:hypothetical protein
LKEFSGSWIALLQLLLDTCPDLETIDLSGTTHIYPRDNATSTGIIQLRGSFAALKDFRMSSPLSGQSYTAIAKMVIRSAATLEVVSFSRSNWGQMDEGLNPFHIGTTASWTQCTRLKELGIYRNGGSLMTDYCWETRTAFSIYEPIQDYSTVFGQLEKLHLAVKEPLWDQCPDGYHIGGVAEWNYTWYEFDYYHDEYFGVYFDEKDDEDWKALKVVAATEEEKNHERRRLQAERNHQRAFIIQVRELFGRLKDLKQLQELQIEWSVCSSIFEMSLEHALGLFQETKVQDDTNTLIRSVSAFEKTSRGWWGEVNEEDLLWLCLPWASRPDIESSKVPSDIIKAAARQYENKTQLPGGCNGIPDCSGESLPWSTGDIYNERVGRQWRDWDVITSGCHPYKESCTRCDGGLYSSCRSSTFGLYDRYSSLSASHVIHSRDYEAFVEGVEGRDEPAWGRKMATKGDRGRYRQKAVGKMNQRK